MLEMKLVFLSPDSLMLHRANKRRFTPVISFNIHCEYTEGGESLDKTAQPTSSRVCGQVFMCWMAFLDVSKLRLQYSDSVLMFAGL